MPLNIFDFSSFPHFFFGLVCFGYAIVVAVKSWHINLHFPWAPLAKKKNYRWWQRTKDMVMDVNADWEARGHCA